MVSCFAHGIAVLIFSLLIFNFRLTEGNTDLYEASLTPIYCPENQTLVVGNRYGVVNSVAGVHTFPKYSVTVL